MKKSWATVVLALTLGACRSGGEASLVVDVRTDLVPGVEFDGVRTLASGRSDDRLADGSQPWFEGVRVAEFGDLSPGELTLTLEVRSAGEVVVRRPLAVRLVRGVNAVTVAITRSCLNVRCPTGDDPTATACLGGRCVDPSCTDETLDACFERPLCTSDESCPAAASCAVPRCVAGSCSYAARPGTCVPSEYCDPEEGCRPRMATDAGLDAGIMDGGTDAGLPDMGPPDMGPPDMGPPDMGPPDMGPPDMGPPDMGPPDMGPPDAGCPNNDGCEYGNPSACSCGETCLLATGGGTRCRAPGPNGPNERCGPGDGCVTGYDCVDPMFTPNRCRPACTRRAHCEAGHACVETADGMGGTCRRLDCDPVAQDCETREGCYPDVTRSRHICEEEGTLRLGQTCDTAANKCEAGTVCVDAGGFRCRELCDPGGADTCSSGRCTAGTGGWWGVCL